MIPGSTQRARSAVASLAIGLMLAWAHFGGAQEAAQPPAAEQKSAAEPVSEIRPPQPGHRFPNGESWVYQVEWRIFDAGVATLRTEPAGREQRITATANSTGVVSMLFLIRDRFEAFLDPRTFCSRQITKHTEEGYRRLETSLRFEPARRKSVLEEKNLKTGAARRLESEIPGCVTDVVSGIYYLRSLSLEPGETYTFPVSDGGKTVNVRALVEDREEIQTPAGAFQTLRVGPAPDERGQVWIWYSDDASRIPVQMRARMVWGTLTFRLERIEHR
ncbi:MAG: DUF3108 domain-containing protein [Acidobacteria bacterium]|nr:DUF3108 domain-containing protein [Acidobacteriota bacterium]